MPTLGNTPPSLKSKDSQPIALAASHAAQVARKAGSAVLLDSLPLAVRLQGAQDTAASQHLKEL
eukprot:gene24836-30261_t